MNQVFSFRRYLWIVKCQWFENSAIYKWGIVFIMLMIPFLFWLFNTWVNVEYSPRLRRVDALFIMGIFLFIYGAFFFIGSFSSKHKMLFYFSLPETPLERVAVAFTFVAILGPVFVATVFTGFDFIFVQLFNHIHGTSEQMLMYIQAPTPAKWFFSVLGGVSSFISIFTLGALMFGKKGPVVSIIFITLCMFIIDRIVIVFGKIPNFIENLILGFGLVFCWVMMYLVMKKKEV